MERKDAQLARLFKGIVEDRLAKEINASEEVYVPVRFMSNPDCINALKNVLCWYNFPKCNDENVSLSLCRTSCEEYYRACNYDVNDTDGLFDPCRMENVERSGLFESGITGPDMRVAEDNVVCRSTEAIVDAMTEAEESVPPWVLTTQGMATVAGGSLLLGSCAFYLLVPDGLRAYAWWWITGIFMKPVYLWRRIPVMRGTTVLLLFSTVVFALVVWGGIRRFSDGGSWFKERGITGPKNFNQAKDKVSSAAEALRERATGLQDSAEAAQEALLERFGISENRTWNISRNENDTADFVPLPASYELQTKQELTFDQRRQLLASCSCTGG